MLQKSDLKVIRGGALSQCLPDEKFISAYATDTRLMGVLVIYVKWHLSGIAVAGKKSRVLHQFFYIETTEEGIESYRGIYGENKEDLTFAEQSMLGGLGAGRVPLTENETVYLVQQYAQMTRDFGNLLPDDPEEYNFILNRDAGLAPGLEDDLFWKLCGKITSENQLVNYFLMRYYAKDFFAARMLASASACLDCSQLADAGLSTLCRNEIIPPAKDGSPEDMFYVCESVLEEDRGHCIVVSEVGVSIERDRPAISHFEVSSKFFISAAEAAMKLARPEYVTVYEISGPSDNLIAELDQRYIGSLQNLTEGGKLYIVFNEDNNHMGKRIYLLNDDVKEIIYVTVENQLIIGSYSLSGIKRIENRMMLSPVANQLFEAAKYEFKEPILYDYTMSYGGNFISYVENMMGFEDDEE